MLEISSMVALGAVRAGVKLGNVHIFDYYRRALRTIVEEGLLSFLRRTSTPYLTRAGSHFDPRSSTTLRTPATALGGSALARGTPDDAADRSTGRGKCRRG